MSTINKLLKKQSAKKRGAALKPENFAAAAAAAAAAEGAENASEEEETVEKADPRFVRWVSNKDGIRLGVPEEWLGKKVGRVFGQALQQGNGRLVQEIE